MYASEETRVELACSQLSGSARCHESCARAPRHRHLAHVARSHSSAFTIATRTRGRVLAPNSNWQYRTVCITTRTTYPVRVHGLRSGGEMVKSIAECDEILNDKADGPPNQVVMNTRARYIRTTGTQRVVRTCVRILTYVDAPLHQRSYNSCAMSCVQGWLGTRAVTGKHTAARALSPRETKWP